MNTKKLFATMLALIVLQFGLYSSLYAEDAPSLSQNEGLFKITLRLPSGMTAPEDGYYFFIYANVYDAANEQSFFQKLVKIETGTSSSTVYIPVQAVGSENSAQILAWYNFRPFTNSGPSLVSGYASETGTSPYNSDFRFHVSKGKVCEITLDAILGVKVSGTLTLPASAKPSKNINVSFRSPSPGWSNYSNQDSLYAAEMTRQFSYSFNLPKDAIFNVIVDMDLEKSVSIIYHKEIDTTQSGDQGIVHNIEIPEPKTVSFSDPYIEQLVRSSAAQPSGPLYDYTVQQVYGLTIDGTKIQSYSDLSKVSSLWNLSIDRCLSIDPFLKALTSLKNLRSLTITHTDLSDLSFLAQCPQLLSLHIDSKWINDHSVLGKLTYLNTAIFSCGSDEDLSFISNCKDMTYLHIFCNWKAPNLSFVKDLRKLNFIALWNASIYTDLSVLRTMNNPAAFNSDVGRSANSRGKKGLESHITLNEKAREILSNIIKPKMSDVQKELAIHDYIINNTVYDKATLKKLGTKDFDPASEAYLSRGCLVNGLAVCEGYTSAFNLLMNSVGIECSIVYNTARNHTWNMVTLDGEYYLVDTTWDDVPASAPDWMRYKYFNVTSDTLRQDHIWDESYYPNCTATKYSYDQLSAPSP